MRKGIRVTACVLAAAVFLGGVPAAGAEAGTEAGTKAALKTKKMNLRVGKKKAIAVKNKKKKAVYTYKSSKPGIAKVSKKGVVTGVKPGKAKITVKEKWKKKVKKIGSVTVVVKKKQGASSGEKGVPAASSQPVVSSVPTISNAPAASNVPAVPSEPGTPNAPAASDAPDVSPSPSASAEPLGTPAPTEVPPELQPIELQPIVHDLPEDFDEEIENVTYGTLVEEEYYSTTTGKDRNVNIILPANYTEEKKYPVLYLLHGIGGNQNEWIRGGQPQYVIGNLVARGLAKEMIVVVPNCRARADDSATNEFSLEHYQAFDNFINDLRDNLMPYVNSKYSVASGRKNTAIAGLSMGGRESLNIGLKMPETFGYIGAFSPGYGVFGYTANGVTEEGLFTEETFRLPEEYKENTLLMLNNGISEGGENAIGGTCHRVLEANGIPHLFYVTEGGHDFKVWKHGLYNFALQIFN